MQVLKWGDDLAVRIPATVAEALNIKEGDQVEIRVTSTKEQDVDRVRKVKEALENIRKARRPFPAGFKFDRIEANESCGA